MEDSESLNFIGSDPGAVKFGNFINYYTFHSAAQRISYLSNSMFPNNFDNETIICLDIGCNTGELTEELWIYLKNVYPSCDIKILAIDIDCSLIQRAQENTQNHNIIYRCLNIMSENGRSDIKQYLESNERRKFDTIFCFSVTMWIHLNYGDEGLKGFLFFIKEISNTIILEPQPWNCYRNAFKRVKKAGGDFVWYKKLFIKSNVETIIEKIITTDSHMKIEEQTAPWKRKIISFHAIINNHYAQ